MHGSISMRWWLAVNSNAEARFSACNFHTQPQNLEMRCDAHEKIIPFACALTLCVLSRQREVVYCFYFYFTCAKLSGLVMRNGLSVCMWRMLRTKPATVSRCEASTRMCSWVVADFLSVDSVNPNRMRVCHAKSHVPEKLAQMFWI